MALAFSLAEENLEIKLEFSKRLLGFVLSRPNAPMAFVKQVCHFFSEKENIAFQKPSYACVISITDQLAGVYCSAVDTQTYCGFGKYRHKANGSGFDRSG